MAAPPPQGRGAMNNECVSDAEPLPGMPQVKV